MALNISGSKYYIPLNDGRLLVTLKEGRGTWEELIAGYEVQLDHWDDLELIKKDLASKVEMKPNKEGELIQVQSIIEAEQDLFNWLGFLDINVSIIIILMLIIGIINMGSALLVMIIIRTRFIGLLKALGSSDWSIRKIFLIQAGYLILQGMLIGNIIGLGLCYLQSHFGLIQLDPTVYYLNTVPIELTLGAWLGLNGATFIICALALFIPSVVIARISPAQSMRFD
jgi:lipoprotein-releasing system permease protein